MSQENFLKLAESKPQGILAVPKKTNCSNQVPAKCTERAERRRSKPIKLLLLSDLRQPGVVLTQIDKGQPSMLATEIIASHP